MTTFTDESEQIPWRDPWKRIMDGGEELVAELQREVCKKHPPYGVNVKAVGHRIDCDDVLFTTSETERPLAVVHLTYSKEDDPTWPATSFFNGWGDWIENCLLGDALEYATDDEIDAAELLRRYSNGDRVFVGVYLPDGSVLTGANLQGATFQDGFFTDVDARRANLRGATFRNMNLKCTDFRGADLTDAVFENVLIELAAFKGAVVTNTVFRGMMFHGQEIEGFRPDDWGWEDSPA